MFYITENWIYLLVGAIAITVVLVIQEWIGHRKRRPRNRISLFARWCMGEYLVLLFALTVSPVYGWSFPHISGNVNLIPFQVLFSFPDGLLNFLGNILLFIPMGIFLRIITGRRGKFYCIFWGLAVSLLIEVLQLFSTRGTDIDDVILNTLGTIIGWMVGYIFYTMIPSTHKIRKTRLRKQRYASKINLLICVSLVVVMVVGFWENDTNSILLNSYAKSDDPILFHSEETEKNADVTVTAASGILICTDNEQILWSKDCHALTQPASCAKLVTALTVLKYCDENEILSVGNEINQIAADASRSYLSIGEELTVRQALIAMLLPSGNDAAYALAVYTGRKITSDNDLSVEKALALFEKEMNGMAQELGAVDSDFCSPDGYDTDGQHTTAYDLAMIGKAAIENELIADITGKAHSKEEWESGETGEYDNTNEMLQQDSPYYVPECTGLKTGTSTNAGACLVMSFTIQDKHYVGVIMGSTEEMRFEDSIQLCNFLRGHEIS